MARLSREQEIALALAAQRGDRRALADLMLSLDGFLRYMASKYSPNESLIDDYAQEGAIAVMNCLPFFVPREDARLTSFLRQPIYWRLIDFRCQDRAIALPGHNDRLFPETREKARVAATVLSLNVRVPGKPEFKSEPAELWQLIIDTKSCVDADQKERIEVLRAAVAELPDPHRRVIQRRIAGLTLEQIGRQFGVTRTRIDQIEGEAWNKLRATIKLKQRLAETRRAQRSDRQTILALETKDAWLIRCQACGVHRIQKFDITTGLWTFNGDAHRPTLMPSLARPATDLTCRFRIINGRIKFSTFCAHALAGEQFPLMPWQSVLLGN
jgi:RNA polymerase sigma factor (sigma-70 family)